MGALFQNTYGKLYIKKRSFSEWLAFVIIVFPFFFSFLTEVLRLPKFIRFSMDMLLAYFFVVLVSNKYFAVRHSIRPLLTLVLIFFVYTLVVYCFNFQSPFYYLWGLRNNFRFYIAFLVFVIYISEDFARSILKLMDFLFWINIVASFVQFLFMDARQDALGGIFGLASSTNGYTLMFFCIVVGKSLLQAFNGTEKYTICAIKCLASFLVAAMAELKFYYIAFILVFIIASMLSKLTRKKFLLMLFCSLGIILGAVLLSNLFESENFLSWETVWGLATKENYSSGKDVNRLSAISTLARDYVTGFGQRLFGLGLGNCDVSEVAIFNSSFYQNYYFLHHTWFTSAMLFLETGFVGIGIYITFFIICLIYSRRQIKINSGNKLFCQMAIIMSIMCIILVFYNSSLRMESGYMAYFVLALPFMARDDKELLNENATQ